MLALSRIKESEKNIPLYQTEQLIEKINEVNPLIIEILRNNSKESKKVAELVYRQNISNLWVIVTSYYSMYYMAKAVLYKNHIKIGDKISHKVTADALIFYIRKKLKDSFIEDYETAQQEALELAGIKTDEIIESFDLERAKRSRFQYSLTEQAMNSKAKTSLEFPLSAYSID